MPSVDTHGSPQPDQGLPRVSTFRNPRLREVGHGRGKIWKQIKCPRVDMQTRPTCKFSVNLATRNSEISRFFHAFCHLGGCFAGGLPPFLCFQFLSSRNASNAEVLLDSNGCNNPMKNICKFTVSNLRLTYSQQSKLLGRNGVKKICVRPSLLVLVFSSIWEFFFIRHECIECQACEGSPA